MVLFEALSYLFFGAIFMFAMGASFAIAFLIVKRVIVTYMDYITSLQNKKYHIKEIQNTLYYVKSLLEKKYPDHTSVQKQIKIIDYLINEIKRRDDHQKTQAIKKETLKRVLPFIENVNVFLKEKFKIILEFCVKNAYTIIQFCKKKWNIIKGKVDAQTQNQKR